jgi:hypothetical protein
VDWESGKEGEEAIEILQDWEFDIEQALPMLSVLFSANDIYEQGVAKERFVEVRKRAIDILDREENDTLQRIMLQLVQAYRYEDFEQGALRNFFLSRVTENPSIAHAFYWIVKLEKDNQDNLKEIRDYSNK